MAVLEGSRAMRLRSPSIPLINGVILMSVFTHEVEVLDPIGLHARPASQIVKLVKETELDVQIGRPGEEFVKAKSALMLMSLKIKTGEKLTLTVETEDEAQAADIAAQIQEFLKG
jgi:phosphotransferase system HPr (HPr) family protein